MRRVTLFLLVLSMTLKRIAFQVGFDLPFYTRTGWPELRTPVPYGEMIPLYGDYADGFWDKEVKEGVGNYYKALQPNAPIYLPREAEKTVGEVLNTVMISCEK